MTLDQTYRGLRVLDLSENIAGPLACLILADLGADVVKVERPGSGEATRSLPPRWGPESTVFLTVNRNKRSVALDIGTPAGRDAVLRIAASTDVVVESFRPGVADRLGLGFDDFRRVSPRVVHCSISAFGEGPLGHDRPGYDAIVQAFTGIMEMTGDADGRPARAAPSVVDVSTGLWAITSIQAALARRTDGSEAQRLEITLVDSGFFLLCHQVMGFLGTGGFPGRLGSAAPSTAPYQAFRTADGAIMIAAATDRLFERLCTALDLPALRDDPRFRTVADRVRARDALTAAIEERLGTAPSEHWLGRISAAGVPAGPVNDLAAALAHPVTRERALVRDAEPLGDALRTSGLRQLRLPIDTDGSCAMREPPALGQHTAEVLAEVGMPPGKILDLVPDSMTEATVSPL
ncbi:MULTISPECIES: CaiB/BaiF CoA transferase family protein [Protofrankia]|uniref:Formyl-CoA transferase n=1 Tax=Candidatus Protofrankia datiscae TaxID=2716812 RepID=F8AWT7_9ACTN|nr:MULTISPECIES: CaiB/BaiF CoA-transferase family protein [Protofrankia]AEH10312.1 Formyl-CoA transferase [Candidatus Protofrankia datiscae]